MFINVSLLKTNDKPLKCSYEYLKGLKIDSFMEKVRETIERLKGKAEIFLKNDTRAFIVDTSDNYYFCHILVIGEDYLYVQHFTGKKKFEKERILWFDIIKFEEYVEKGDGKDE